MARNWRMKLLVLWLLMSQIALFRVVSLHHILGSAHKTKMQSQKFPETQQIHTYAVCLTNKTQGDRKTEGITASFSHFRLLLGHKQQMEWWCGIASSIYAVVFLYLFEWAHTYAFTRINHA